MTQASERWDGYDEEATQAETPPVRDFRRTTPARLKPIPVLRRRGHWGLLAGTALFVMVTASLADYVPVTARVVAHLLMWAAVGVALLVVIQREQRHGWQPAARWPWGAAIIGGTAVTELLVLVASSPVVMLGSAVVLVVGLVVVLTFG
ncbi:hypothetical protein ACQEU5_11650 [Marinactinospora thermotolerans]|uniref:Uncharacterized protein n=1 Tax=Marinactinospora thermotolerans DSM 45154 TaxID=1122192 RepID=A0A1T4SZF1_9ACTN|nr:hypothetical protein [Marinactinospora thermotolerans]SKA33565.1 hypothetical protein SAMN02745673_04227 [Marinactinospora thermotolerans DSM 45154]